MQVTVRLFIVVVGCKHVRCPLSCRPDARASLVRYQSCHVKGACCSPARSSCFLRMRHDAFCQTHEFSRPVVEAETALAANRAVSVDEDCRFGVGRLSKRELQAASQNLPKQSWLLRKMRGRKTLVARCCAWRVKWQHLFAAKDLAFWVVRNSEICHALLHLENI